MDHDLSLGGGSDVAGVEMNIMLGVDDPLEEFNLNSGQGKLPIRPVGRTPSTTQNEG